jgi:hypothetical protein
MPERAVSTATGSIGNGKMDLPPLEPLSAIRKNVVRICHDLRIPLTAILANAEFLTKPKLTEGERGEFFCEISAFHDRNDLISIGGLD